MVEAGQTPAPDERTTERVRDRARYVGVHAEVVIVTGVLLLVGIGFSDWFTFFALAPSPLLLPVLWGALRGGLLPALTATVLVGSLHTLGAVVAADQDFSILTGDGFTWPLFAFAVVAYVVGQTRDLLATRLATLRGTRERLQVEGSRQRRDIDVLEHANRELKRRIFDRSFDFDSLVATVARSSIDDDEHMFEAPLGMLVDFCGATKCSVLLVLPDETLDLAAHRGWEDDEIGPRLRIANNSTRVLRAIVEARPIVDLPEDESEAAGPLLIAPIADGTGVIKALVCIDEMPPLRFDESSVKTFLGIVSWLATNLRRIQMREATGENAQHVLSALEKQKHLGSIADLAERIHLEDARRKRYGIETELIAIRLLDSRVNMADYVELLESYLAKVLSSAVRLTDDIFTFGFAGCYVLVLTGCKQGNGEGMIARLAGRFDASADQGVGPVDLCHFATTTECPTLGDLLSPLTDHFNGASPVPLALECPVPEPRAQRSGNAQEFARRLRLETDLARRFGLELNMVDFRRDGPGFGVGPMIARHLWNSVGTLLRVTDGIYVVSPNRCVVLLPCTSCLDASAIWARLEESLRNSLPSDRYEDVRADFLSLDAANLSQTVHYLVGPLSNDSEEESEPMVITESELQELTFSDAEFAGMQFSSENLEKDFRVLATSGADVPALPSPEAITRRWEEVFEGREVQDPKSDPETHDSEEAEHLDAEGRGPNENEVQEPVRSDGEPTGIEPEREDQEREQASGDAEPTGTHVRNGDQERDLPVTATVRVEERMTRIMKGLVENGEERETKMVDTKASDRPEAEAPENGMLNARDRWRAIVGGVVAELAIQGEPFSSNDVRACATERGVGEPHHPNAWGAAMTSAYRRGLIEKTGCSVKSKGSARNSARIAEWVGCLTRPMPAEDPRGEGARGEEAQSADMSPAPGNEDLAHDLSVEEIARAADLIIRDLDDLSGYVETGDVGGEVAGVAEPSEPNGPEAAGQDKDVRALATAPGNEDLEPGLPVEEMTRAADLMMRNWDELCEDVEEGVAEVVEQSASDGWGASVSDVVAELAAKGEPFSTNDVRALAAERGVEDPPHPNAWGAAIMAAARRGQIGKTGRELESEVVTRRVAKIAEWVGSPATPAEADSNTDLSTDPDSSVDSDTVRILLEQIEGLRALCLRLTGQLPEDAPRE